MDLSRFPRRRYTPYVTPLEFLPRFTEALAASCPDGKGPNIWIKRDDMLGLFPGGNKTRKLEFLAADALAQGADTLVTCGAPQSNHCRITLAAAVKEGLKCRFVIEERVPNSYSVTASGNNFMFRLMEVEAITVVPGGSNMAQAMQTVMDDLAAQGRKGYVIPGGGSNAVGGLGYVACAQELQQQFFDQGVQIDRMVVGSGSSGTHGGLLAGFLGNHIHIPIVGIGVSRDPADQEPLVLQRSTGRGRPAQAQHDHVQARGRWSVWVATGNPNIPFPMAPWSRPCRCWPAPKAFHWTRCTPARSWRG
jgi:D-cysteine desulfhydrase